MRLVPVQSCAALVDWMVGSRSMHGATRVADGEVSGIDLQEASGKHTRSWEQMDGRRWMGDEGCSC